MKNMKRLKNTIICILIFVMVIQSSAFSADLRFIEIDEIPATGYLSLSGTTVNGVPPFRNSSMQPIFTRVNAQYSEPRPASVDGMHRGVDFRSLDGSTKMKVYPIWGEGEIFQVDDAQNTSYGKYVRLQHKYTYGGNTYYFQSHYAHLSEISCDSSGTLNINSLIGTSGGTNKKNEDDFPVHLHLEARAASSSKAANTRKYPPNFFFGSLSTTITNQMSFINRTAASASSVTFKIAPVILGTEYTTPSNRITFKYRADNGSWQNGTMTTSDNKFFTANLSGLYTNKIEYYVIAQSDAWVFGVWRDAYRPYRYSDAVPSDRPFVQYKTGSYSLDVAENEDYCTVIEPQEIADNKSVNNDINETVRLIGTVTSISDDWVIGITTQDNRNYQVKIIDNNETGSPLKVGEKIAVGCEVNKRDKSLSTYGADILVYSVYEGATY